MKFLIEELNRKRLQKHCTYSQNIYRSCCHVLRTYYLLSFPVDPMVDIFRMGSERSDGDENGTVLVERCYAYNVPIY